MSGGSPVEIMSIVLCRDISRIQRMSNNEHDLHRGSPTHLFLFLCRTIDAINSSSIVPVLRDLHRRSRCGDRVQNRPYYGIKWTAHTTHTQYCPYTTWKQIHWKAFILFEEIYFQCHLGIKHALNCSVKCKNWFPATFIFQMKILAE